MYEIDFLPIEKTGELGSRSGDAITMRFTESLSGVQRVVVIDGGFAKTADSVIEHIDAWYGTTHIDLMISTHPDQDHINGLASIMEGTSVGELLVHNPHEHAANVDDFSNIEVVDALIGMAEERGIPVIEPFTGLQRFGGHITVLGPTESYYEELIAQHLAEMKTGVGADRMKSSMTKSLWEGATDLLERTLPQLPIETLGEDGDSGPRNDSSVVTLLRIEGERMLFTGDAGIPAMNQAWDEYERIVGSFPDFPLDLFQAPHHGSRRNLSPSVLNRIFGEPGTNLLTPPSVISSAKNDPKHPSPKVTNALRRRNVQPFATESKNVVQKSDDVPMRPGYSSATPIGPLDEGDD